MASTAPRPIDRGNGGQDDHVVTDPDIVADLAIKAFNLFLRHVAELSIVEIRVERQKIQYVVCIHAATAA